MKCKYDLSSVNAKKPDPKRQVFGKELNYEKHSKNISDGKGKW